MVAVRTCIPTVGDASDRFMAVSTTRSGTGTGRVKLERFAHPRVAFFKSAGTAMRECMLRPTEGSQWFVWSN